MRKLRPSLHRVITQKIHRFTHISQGIVECFSRFLHQQRHKTRRFLLVEGGGLFENGSAHFPAQHVPIMLICCRRDHGLGRCLFIGLVDHADIDAAVMGRIDVS